MFPFNYLVFFPFSIISHKNQIYHLNTTIIICGAAERNFRTKMISQTSDSIKHKCISALFSVYKCPKDEHCLGTFRNGKFLFSRVILGSLRQCFWLYDLYTLFLLMLPNNIFGKVWHDVVTYYSKYRTVTKFVSCTAFFSFSRPKNHLKFSSQTPPYESYSVFFMILSSKEEIPSSALARSLLALQSSSLSINLPF